MEHARTQRIADRWIGEPVEVEHHVESSGVVSLGATAGTLEVTDDTGVLLSITDPERGSVEHRYFLWSSVIPMAASVG
jgi:hypothetical protein